MERHHDEWKPLVGVGAAYEFPLGDRWALAPGIYYDFLEGDDLLTFGVNLIYVW